MAWKSYGRRELRWRARYGSRAVLGLTLPAPLVREFSLRPGDLVEVEGDPVVGEIRLRVCRAGPVPPEAAVEGLGQPAVTAEELAEMARLVEEVIG